MFKNLPTFRSLPQAIGLPFLSSTEDAQLKFKSGNDGIKRLSDEEVIISISQTGCQTAHHRSRSSPHQMLSIGNNITRFSIPQRTSTLSSPSRTVRPSSQRNNLYDLFLTINSSTSAQHSTCKCRQPHSHPVKPPLHTPPIPTLSNFFLVNHDTPRTRSDEGRAQLLKSPREGIGSRV